MQVKAELALLKERGPKWWVHHLWLAYILQRAAPRRWVQSMYDEIHKD